MHWEDMIKILFPLLQFVQNLFSKLSCGAGVLLKKTFIQGLQLYVYVYVQYVYVVLYIYSFIFPCSSIRSGAKSFTLSLTNLSFTFFSQDQMNIHKVNTRSVIIHSDSVFTLFLIKE